jgi:TolA-binding protein
VDPGDWIPIIGVGLLALTTFAALAGALSIGRARGLREGSRRRSEEIELQSRLERMEHQLASMSGEIERLGDVQRFSLKVMGERLEAIDAPKSAQGRIITPH